MVHQLAGCRSYGIGTPDRRTALRRFDPHWRACEACRDCVTWPQVFAVGPQSLLPMSHLRIWDRTGHSVIGSLISWIGKSPLQ